jgi:hypothetical protein
VAFTGEMEQDNATAVLNPLSDETVMVDVPLFPTIAVAEVGAALNPKSISVRA